MLPSYSASTLYSTLQTAPQFGPLPLDTPVCLMRSQFHPTLRYWNRPNWIKVIFLASNWPRNVYMTHWGPMRFPMRPLWADGCLKIIVSFFWDSFHGNNFFFSFCKLSCTNMSGPGRSQHLEGIRMKKITGEVAPKTLEEVSLKPISPLHFSVHELVYFLIVYTQWSWIFCDLLLVWPKW